MDTWSVDTSIRDARSKLELERKEMEEQRRNEREEMEKILEINRQLQAQAAKAQLNTAASSQAENPTQSIIP